MAKKEDKFEGRVPPIESEQGSLWEHLPTRSIAAKIKREQIDDLVKEQGQKAIPQLIQILRTSPVENNRETAAKSLGLYGGEPAVTALEGNIYYENPGTPPPPKNPTRDRNFWVAKNAAMNALRALGFTSPSGSKHDNPPLGIINPYRLENYIKSIKCTVQNVPDIAARLANSLWDSDFEISLLRHRSQDFSLKQLGLIRIEFRFNLDPDNLVAICEKHQLTVNVLADNIIQVKGDSWPGFKLTRPELNLIFIGHSDNTQEGSSSVISGHIPEATLCTDLESVVRLLTRMAYWTSNGYVLKKKQSAPQQPATSKEVTVDDLFDLANLIDS